jgi:hypothetical protein
MLSFSISYPYLIKVSLLCGPRSRRVGIGGERRPTDRVTSLRKTLISPDFYIFKKGVAPLKGL